MAGGPVDSGNPAFPPSGLSPIPVVLYYAVHVAIMLQEEQREQESQYLTPYHWSYTPETETGRVYFSYLNMAASLIPADAKTLADIGCGDGRSTSFFKDSRPDLQITGMDYSDQAIQLSKTMSVPRRIEWSTWDVTMPLAQTATFDVVTAIEMFEHLPTDSVQTALKNVHSILNPGGCLIMTVPSKNVPVNKKHYQHFDAIGLTSMLKDAGFSDVSIRGQENGRHFFFQIYRFADNRWWSIQPIKKWLNATYYQKHVGPSSIDSANRLVVKATF
jgi:2-polyprenyl-3-methyl-5-hydroxy-6-metoxy-1,4-benzoquinol methylase